VTARVRIPRTPAALERIWNAVPPAAVWFWVLTGELPTIAEELDAREAESTRPSS
jgi:hypothetical protein